MDPYMNVLHSNVDVGLSPNQNEHHNGQQGLSPEQEMRRQMNEFSRSVTIVIWYQANTEPIRLHRMLPTFPYFQLSQVNNLINDLGLSASSYLDAWMPNLGQWEQQTITVVRVVESQQRLLYKVRRRLTEPLSDAECVHLRDEFQIQTGNIDPRIQGHELPLPPPDTTSTPISVSSPPKPQIRTLSISDTSNAREGQAKRPLKRSAPSSDVRNPGPSPKIQLMNGYYMPHPPSSSNTMVSSPEDVSSPHSPPPPSHSLSTSSTTSNDQPQSPHDGAGDDNNNNNQMYMYQSIFYSQQSQPQHGENELPQYLIAPPAPAAPIPYHPHPPLKRWPNDYTVSEIASGFHAMDLLIAHAAASGGMTQRQAFERVFGCRYVKSTVCRHRAVWRRAHQSLKEQFEALGSDERACWGEFVRRVEGRPPGKSGSSTDSIMSPSPGGTMGYQSAGEDDEVLGQEGVMTLQNQMPSSNGSSMQAGNMVYDPSRNHMNNGSHGG